MQAHSPHRGPKAGGLGWSILRILPHPHREFRASYYHSVKMLQFFRIHCLTVTCVWEIRAGLLMPMNHCDTSCLALGLWDGPRSSPVSFLKWTLTMHFRASTAPWSLQNKDFSGGQQECCVLDLGLLHQPQPATTSPPCWNRLDEAPQCQSFAVSFSGARALFLPGSNF